MAISFLDVCRFNPSASGTADFLVSGAVTGYQTPSSAGAVNGAIYRYRAESGDLSQWEVGYGAYNTGTSTLARTTILFSSASNAKVSFTAAPQVAAGFMLAEDCGPLTLASATLQATPTNPTGTTATAGVMMGVGGACALTPKYSTRILLAFSGNVSDTGATSGITVDVVYGTGTAPANGVSLTGTVIGNGTGNVEMPTTGPVPWALTNIITGLTPGTAYWFDLRLKAAAGTASVANLTCTAKEF